MIIRFSFCLIFQIDVDVERAFAYGLKSWSIETIHKISPCIVDLKNKRDRIFKKLEELSKQPGYRYLK